MKKILRRLTIVDYLALGSGLGLTLAYLLFKHDLNTNSPILDVWPNIATEILGIWISVRVIDELIQRREKKKNTRAALVDGLVYFLELARELQPEVYDWKVQRLSGHLEWYIEKYPSRTKYIFSDEDALAQKAIDTGKKICTTAQDYSKERNNLLLIRADFEQIYIGANQARNTILERIEKLEYPKRKDEEAKLPKFSELIQGMQNNFHATELTVLEEEYSLFCTRKLDDGFRQVDWHKIIPLRDGYLNNSLRLLESEFNKFRDFRDYSPTKLLETISSISQSVDISKLPPILQRPVTQYGEILTDLANKRISLEKEIKEMELLVKDFSSNIFEETSINE